ncbi:hypothetical protein JL193_13065 [Polaribacter batillariae]|uniref:Uncharacterized protein n=1 Tax=Polaribacter batillariae TaxID=2808900 RepID=A0ABX7SU84_9FLAO|nr:hypothetical protein [Polaribacter batillariae]QTD37043.1 hypothetical protein JL193_13065 [Polaribacter batillariae]
MKISLKLTCLFLLGFALIITSCTENNIKLTSKNNLIQFEFHKNGSFIGIFDQTKSENYLDTSNPTYLMSIRINDVFEHPISMEINEDLITLKYPSNTQAQIKYIRKERYFTFELVGINGSKEVDLITWGPYYTTINKTIGETIGVVRNDKFALGVQALNIKTLGGFPYNENDCMPEFDIFTQEDVTDMGQEGKSHVLYRIEAAKPTKTGSSLQTYCRNRDKDRIIENLGHTKFVAPKYDDGGVIGSKIAFFGVPTEEALQTIGAIEVAEGLPHPTINGQWMKTAPEAAAAYIIMNFNEETIDDAIEVTKKAGLKHLYHYGKTFESWGHFQLFKEAFPNGYDGMKACVEKAKKEGISIGGHTLSNFITTNDPYVTPIPDKRLAEVGRSIITSDIDKKQTEIAIESPDFFNQFKNNNLRTVRIGNELIRYGSVTEKKPWKLLDCQRGAFNTQILQHKSNTPIAKLLDHPYKVFLSNTSLTKELSKNIANLYNKTGMKQISFDGLEGNKSTGLGNYGETMMPYEWYNNLSEDLKDGLIIDASRTTHFFWHLYTRMNWGEPWYANFRESQTQYRMKNQAYFRRNYMPGMLGWFRMTPEISLEDMEWMLSRTAAFDAGYAFITSKETLKKHGQSNAILELVKQWERARLAGVFPSELKKEMEDLKNEYHLAPVSENSWNLFPIAIDIFKHSKKVRQPGEPLYSTFNFKNTSKKQPLVFTIKLAEATKCRNIIIELDNYKKIKLPITLTNQQIFRYEGGKQGTLFDKNWNVIKTIDLDIKNVNVSKGSHSLTVDCDFLSDDKSEIIIEVKTIGEPKLLTK